MKRKKELSSKVSVKSLNLPSPLLIKNSIVVIYTILALS
jgi:hypothetical protein